MSQMKKVLFAAILTLFASTGMAGVIQNPGFTNLQFWETKGLAFDFGAGTALIPTSVDQFASDLDAFLGTGVNLQNFPEAEAGSALKQTINVNVGDIIKFDWESLFFPNGPSYDGIAFWAFGGNLHQLATHQQSTAQPNGNSSNSGSVIFTVTQSGAFDLGFGILDAPEIGFDLYGAELYINALSITPNSNNNAIPEPNSATIAACGAIASLLLRYRKR